MKTEDLIRYEELREELKKFRKDYEPIPQHTTHQDFMDRANLRETQSSYWEKQREKRRDKYGW